MKEHEKLLSFGRYLRAVRRERGIGLEQISKETRIGLETLNLIEQEDISGLPAEVFVKGFIRSYAKAVGADADRAVAGYLQGLAKVQKSEQSEADLDRLSNRFWPHMMMAGGILILVIVGSIFALSGLQDQEKEPVVSERQTARTPPPETAPAPSAPAQEPAQAPAEPPEVPAADSGPPALPPAEVIETTTTKPTQAAQAPAPLAEKQVLEITAVAETWMQIVIDDEKTKEVTLKPGDQLALEASKGYQLLIGNAAGVIMRLNGAPIQVEGRSGQVRSLTLP